MFEELGLGAARILFLKLEPLLRLRFPRRSKQKASNWLAKTWAGVQREAKIDIDLRQMRSAYINSADELGLSDNEILEMTQHMSESVVKRHYIMFKDKRGARNAQAHSQMLDALRLAERELPDSRSNNNAGEGIRTLDLHLGRVGVEGR